jgi:hypothetical protein
MRIRSWLWLSLLVLLAIPGALLRGLRAHTTRDGAPRPDGPRVVDVVRAKFSPAQGWFRLVADARFETDARGALTPDYTVLKHPRVRPADAAGRSIVPSFPAVYTDPLRVSVAREPGVSVGVSPVGAHAAHARVEDGLVVYPDAWTDTDVLYKSTPTHTDEYLLLRTERAPTTWRYRVTLGAALRALKQTPGAVEVVDAQGLARLRAGRPVAIDARGDRVMGDIRVEGETLVVTVDLHARPFPVLVDPDWRPTGDMAYGRFYHGANVLPDGRVLATGGCSASVCSGDLTIPACRTVVNTAETLDLGTRTWSRAAEDPVARFFHVSESLADGSVLVAGGCTDPDCTTTTPSAQRYDPATRAFQPVAMLSEARAGMSAVRLGDGRVLVVGGCTGTRCSARVELYDPTTRAWTRRADLATARGRATATLLTSGRVLVAGGCTTITCATALASAEVYAPASDRWTTAAPMSTARGGHYAVELVDGRVIVGGGCPDGACGTFLDTTELFDPAGMRFGAGPRQRAPRVGARAVRLPDGSVMVNQGCQSRTGCDLSNELLDARATSFAAMEPALTIRAFHETLVHSPARTVISIGGCQPRTCSWWNETYDISNIRPLVDAGMTTDASADVPAVRDVSEVDRAVTTDVTADGSGDAGATLEDVGGAVDAASGQDVPRGEPPPGGCACEVTSLATQRPEPWVVFFVFGLIAMRRGAYSRRRGS